MAVSSAQSASSIKFDYMTLLVTQMKNQNPLEPMNNDQMATQMAQFSQLEQLENMNSTLTSANTSFSDILANAQMSYATTLVGKKIAYTNQDTGLTEVAKVLQADIIDGKPQLRVGDNKSVDLADVVAVAN